MNICSPLDFYLPARESCGPPYTSPDLAHNLLSDRLWVPLLHM